MLFWRKNETPSALISTAIRGAFRSGRYANRSMATPTTPAPSIPARNMSTMSGKSAIDGEGAPPNTLSTPKPMNAPTMYTSPCAKFRSFRIP